MMLFYVFIMIFTFFILLYETIRLLLLFNHPGFFHSATKRACGDDIVENIIQSILRQYILGLTFKKVIVATVAIMVFFN